MNTLHVPGHTAASAWGVTGPNSQRRKLNATWPEGGPGSEIPRLQSWRRRGVAKCAAHVQVRTSSGGCGLAGGQESPKEGGCALRAWKRQLLQSFGEDFTDHRG